LKYLPGHHLKLYLESEKMIKMKFCAFLFITFSLLPGWTAAQGANYAGENTTACQGAGALIGNGALTDVCYTWEPADGLDPSDIHSQTPVVHPQHTTTYTVHVTGENFAFSATDQVKVIVDFGGLVITPSYIDLAGSLTDQAQAVLTINHFQGSAHPVIWSIENAGNTGCVISSNGVISNCSESGSVKVRATNGEYPGCYAEVPLEINGGIKDVTAQDIANPGRIAHHDDTLYLVGSAKAKITAEKNDNSSFPAGQPTWNGDYPPDPGVVSFETPLLQPGNYEFQAGAIDPKSVAVEDLGENAQTVMLGFSSELILNMVEALKGNLKVIDADPFCFPPLEFDPSFISGFKVSYKSANSIKYNDPGYDTKYEASLEIPGVAIEGCMLFPCCSGIASIGIASAQFYTYFKAGLTMNIAIAGAKDPSLEDSGWKLSSLSSNLGGALEVGMQLQSNFTPAGFGAFLNVNLSTSAELKMQLANDPDKVEWIASWGGLVGKAAFTVFYITPDNAIEISKQKNFINGRDTGWMTMFEFPN
jgi:hypothetical protein